MSAEDSKFDLWWNSRETKRIVGAAYSLGAAVVIIGAMFKILHLPGAQLMLGLGMSVEAILFSLGVLDKPHKEYEWDKVYDFEGEGAEKEVSASSTGVSASSTKSSISSPTKASAESLPGRAVGLNYTETIDDEDVYKLSEGIKNLSTTAQQLQGLSNVIISTDKFAQNIDDASLATESFIKSQVALNGSTSKLSTSYQGINDGMLAVEKNTKMYASKVEDINKNLSSINSIYEIQLKNIQAQSEGLSQQTENVHSVTNELKQILGNAEKMKNSSLLAAEATENYKLSSIKLAKQVSDLNNVYGNMLNALN